MTDLATLELLRRETPNIARWKRDRASRYLGWIARRARYLRAAGRLLVIDQRQCFICEQFGDCGHRESQLKYLTQADTTGDNNLREY